MFEEQLLEIVEFGIGVLAFEYEIRCFRVCFQVNKFANSGYGEWGSLSLAEM